MVENIAGMQVNFGKIGLQIPGPEKVDNGLFISAKTFKQDPEIMMGGGVFGIQTENEVVQGGGFGGVTLMGGGHGTEGHGLHIEGMLFQVIFQQFKSLLVITHLDGLMGIFQVLAFFPGKIVVIVVMAVHPGSTVLKKKGR
jgi:hypothetical protein